MVDPPGLRVHRVQPRADLVHQQGRDVRQGVHVDQLEQRPPPPAGLAAHHRQGAHALHGEHEPHQQADGDHRRPHRPAIGAAVGLERLVQGHRVVLGLADAVDDAQGADEDLARGEGADQADADLPVEAQGGDGRLHEHGRRGPRRCARAGRRRRPGRLRTGRRPRPSCAAPAWRRRGPPRRAGPGAAPRRAHRAGAGSRPAPTAGCSGRRWWCRPWSGTCSCWSTPGARPRWPGGPCSWASRG